MLKTDHAVLVVVDVQGRLATLMHDADSLFRNVRNAIRGAKALGLPVLWNEQLPDKLGGTVPEIREDLLPLSPIVKSCFSCYGSEAFVRQLRACGRKQVLLCGIETHICVYQTAVDLLGAGYEVHLLADAASSRTQFNHHIGIDRIRDAGAFISSVEMALFEMVKKAEGEAFRQIVKIVK
ncbi:MAG: hydrolase [Elusimicrobiota bacterium]